MSRAVRFPRCVGIQRITYPEWNVITVKTANQDEDPGFESESPEWDSTFGGAPFLWPKVFTQFSIIYPASVFTLKNVHVVTMASGISGPACPM